MTALMSSAYASMFGGCQVALRTPKRQVLAERLMNNGYWTAGFTANPVCGGMNGFHRGFGTFRDERKISATAAGTAERLSTWREMVAKGIPPRELDPFSQAAELTDVGLKWINERPSGEPLFLWLHYMDPHWPCLTTEPPADTQALYDAWYDRHVLRTEVIPRKGRYDVGEEMRARWIDRYRTALHSADCEIGRFLDVLRSRPDWDNTIVAALGDHGEEFYEHGAWHHSWNGLYREGIHVPLILKVPGSAALTVTEPVSNLDLAPTLLDYAKASQAEHPGAMMGTSLRPVMEGKMGSDRPVYSEMLCHPGGPAYRLAILHDGWKYLYDLENPHSSKLFRTEDFDERDDLRELYPDVLRRFEKMRLEHVVLGLTALMKRNGLANDAAPMDPVVREQMIALGYIQAN